MKTNPVYKKGQTVLIERVFVVEGCTGMMKKLDKPERAVITRVEVTPSMGPCYTVKWVDEDLPKPAIKYWEGDILCATD